MSIQTQTPTEVEPVQIWPPGELVKVLREAGQEVPRAMNDFDLSIKRKEHKLYGNFGPKDDGRPMKKATKITFD